MSERLSLEQATHDAFAIRSIVGGFPESKHEYDRGVQLLDRMKQSLSASDQELYAEIVSTLVAHEAPFDESMDESARIEEEAKRLMATNYVAELTLKLPLLDTQRATVFIENALTDPRNPANGHVSRYAIYTLQKYTELDIEETGSQPNLETISNLWKLALKHPDPRTFMMAMELANDIIVLDRSRYGASYPGWGKYYTALSPIINA